MEQVEQGDVIATQKCGEELWAGGPNMGGGAQSLPSPLIPGVHGGWDSPLLTQEGDIGLGPDLALPEAPHCCTQTSISAWEIRTTDRDGNASPWRKDAPPSEWCWSRGHPSTEGRGTPLTPMQRDSKGTQTQTQNFKLHNFEKKTGEDLWDPTLGNEP